MEPAPFKMAAAQTNSTLAAGIRALRAHFDSVILPMWMGPGFNQALGLPFESLDAASGNPLPAERYRAMACARQLYVYVEASGPTRPRMPTACSSPCAPISRMRAAAGATAWTRRRVRWTRPGSLYPRLHRVRLRRVFPALAQRRARKLMLGAAETIEARFKRPDGLYEAAVASDWSRARAGPESHDASDRSLPGRRAGGRTGAVRAAAARAGAGHLPAFRACAHAVCPRRRRNPGQPA